MTEENTTPVNFFEYFDDVQSKLGGKEIVLFLDYDGTLTPIVATPDMAIISDDMRQTVREASESMTVSIVSGRATDDVRSKVKLEGIFYAGSHGFEIVDPKGEVTINEEAAQIRTTIDEVHEKLSGRLKNVKGALIENVKYTISSHYRLVADEDFPRIEKEIDKILEEYPVLRKTHGKKVFEIRPKINWDKGKAVKWIMNTLQMNEDSQIPVYIGDDTTDEDGFRVLKNKGLGILVASQPRESEAQYMIQDTGEVAKVLRFFIEYSKKSGV